MFFDIISVMQYYQKKLFLVEVDVNDKIIGRIERWRAHKEGILHRGFTVVLTYRNHFVFQRRKHLAFDKALDLSFSSHQVYAGERLQTDLEAIYIALQREWNIDKTALIEEPKLLQKFYYKAKDTQSIFTEHEIDYVYKAELKNYPLPNLDYAYGCCLIEKEKMKNLAGEIPNFNLVPWASEIVKFI